MCTCFIVPRDILTKLSQDPRLPPDIRKAAADTARVAQEIRDLRIQALRLTSIATMIQAPVTAIAAAPAITVFDCGHTQSLPGRPISGPQAGDDSAKRAFDETTQVAKFYKDVFGRNSIDNAGMTMMSSIHYGNRFNNAMWNGTQMLYGDGDNAIFVDFTLGNDVIGHELTHGVTQHSLQLEYTDDAGGLNESLSDCFGSMFRQWEKGQDAAAADWLIGSDIIGPSARDRNITCLRDMADPAGAHCLAPQPTQYSQITPGMDPHYSSGPPNLAFYTACKTLGGKSWEKIGQVWYRVMTTFGPSPRMKIPEFANRTRQVAGQMFGGTPDVGDAIEQGWSAVGLSRSEGAAIA
ncbi:MAG: M4 family metallopeptidase [Methylobacteriaceae bacterium]|nr:M4 family metallopeptidase [Methylobacteriaceae bacterium]